MDGRVCQKLVMHPASRCDAVRCIAVAIARDAAGGLGISFRVAGEIDRLRLPEAAMPLRADGLWQHSCFEVFLRADANDAYLEYNFAPSGAWACYRFGHRRMERVSPEVPVPRILAQHSTESFEMNVHLVPAALAGFADAVALQAGPAAVIEDRHGTLSYWALAHASPQPDFHDPAGFRMIVPAR